MAGAAIRAEARRLVIRSVRLCVGLDVTRDAVGRKPSELAHGCSLMAGVAFQDGVCADQREAVKVLARLLYRYLPALHRVALFAVRSKLSLVDIGVAVCALRTDV